MQIEWKRIDSFKWKKQLKNYVEYRLCPFCLKNPPNEKTILYFDDFQYYSDSDELPKRIDVKVVQCHYCFGIYLNPCYSEVGFNVLSSEAGCSYGASGDRATEQINWMKENDLLQTGNLVLDVGCYDGKFLSQLPNNLQRVGIDIDRIAIEHARNRYRADGIEFLHDKLENFRYEKALDVITMTMVLEHIPRPSDVLKNLKSLSKSTTKLFIEVPILEKGNTNDICGFLSVWHTSHFSRNSLKRCIEKSGWKIVKWYEQNEYNGCRLIAIPAIEYETPMNSGDIELLYSYLAHWYTKIGEFEKKLQLYNSAKKIIIWGGGLHTEFIYQLTSFFHINPFREYLIIDNDPIKEGISHGRKMHVRTG